MTSDLTPRYDVIIIGASITGASLAYALGSTGIKTAIIDKKIFPRWKPCGEGLSPVAMPYLKKLGLLETVLALPGSRISNYCIRLGPLKIKLPTFSLLKKQFNSEHILGINRSELDYAIIKKALETGAVDFIQDEKIVSSSVCGHIVNTSRGQLQGRYIVIAAGNNHSFLDSNLFTLGKDRFGLSTHLTFSKEHNVCSVEIIPFKNLQIFVTPISLTQLNLSVLGSQIEVQDLAKTQLIPAIEIIREKLNLPSCNSSGIMGAGPFCRRANKRIINNTILVGDAYESLDPIGGMGMTQGIISAQSLAEALRKILIEGQDPLSVFKCWNVSIKKKLLLPKIFTNIVSLFLDRVLSLTQKRMGTDVTSKIQVVNLTEA